MFSKAACDGIRLNQISLYIDDDNKKYFMGTISISE